MDITCRELKRPSSCGEGNLFSRVWLPDKEPRAAVQITHGMKEHAGRYVRIANRLAKNGYLVCANDHIGHGKSSMGHMGTFSMKPGGFDYLLRDMRSMFDYVDKEYPGLPHVLFGHSMGSIAAGIYPESNGGVDALILMGMPAPNKMAVPGILIGKAVSSVRGRTAESKFLSRAAAADMGKQDQDPIKRNAWLTRDENEVVKVSSDPLYGKYFSASAYSEMLSALHRLGSRGWAGKMPDIPIMIMGGAADSVGHFGRAPEYYSERLKKAGRDVTLKLYPECRHELLNELNRDEVEEDIINFINKNIENRG